MPFPPPRSVPHVNKLIHPQMSLREDAAGRERAGDTEAVCAFILPVAGVIQNLVQRQLPLGDEVALADIAMKAAGAIRCVIS